MVMQRLKAGEDPWQKPKTSVRKKSEDRRREDGESVWKREGGGEDSAPAQHVRGSDGGHVMRDKWASIRFGVNAHEARQSRGRTPKMPPETRSSEYAWWIAG